ncbi:MAG: hypothetical protein WCB27_08205 [Thermoguttaceae bacterium]|jgi:hypothetical protein
MTANDPQPATPPRKLRWYQPTPGRLLVGLLVVEGILLLSKPWFPKGYSVLIAIASVGVTVVLILVWLGLALCFHWRFQFSLRSLMVATVAVAIPFSWLAVETEQAKRQREIVERIQKLGGNVLYNGQLDAILSPAPPGPIWLGKLLGDDFFANVVQVLLGGTHVTDDDLEQIEGLTQLKVLFLGHTHITDAGLVHVRGMRELGFLWLIGTHVTDDGVKKLQMALPNCDIEH